MRRVISLAGKWDLKLLFSGEDPGTVKLKGSIPAEVPGIIQRDIAREMGIKDIYYAANYRKLLWVPYESWLLRKEITINEDGYKELVLDGVDYDCDVWINGKHMLRHKGAFSRIRVPLEGRGKFEIRVRLNPTPVHQNKAVRCQMSYGWDFAPRIIAMGIWRDARVEISGLPKILDAHARLKKNKVYYEISLEGITENANVMVYLLDAKKKTIASASHAISRGEKIIHGILDVNPERWYPRLLGDQVMYSLLVETYKGKDIMDSKRVNVGFRTVLRTYTPNAHPGDRPWQFIINGEKVFILGANFVPVDSLYGGVPPERYLRLLDMAEDAGINMFRVWGGGLIAHDILYDEADKRGIMIWQEFPLACTDYPKDREFRQIIAMEAKDSILRLRNHPSLVLFCGGNEISPKHNHAILETIKEIEKKLAPHVPFEYASPLPGTIHNWITWHQLAPFEALEIVENFQMMDEFGFQAFPAMDTLKAMMPNPSPENPYIEIHKGELNKLKRYASIGKWKNMEEFVFFSQLAQAIGLQTGIEACRRRKPRVAGVLFWQFNEPWPAISWAVVDYYMRPKKAYEWIKRLYSPVLPMLTWKRVKNEFEINVWIANELKEDISGKIRVESYCGRKLLQAKEKKIPPVGREKTEKVWHTNIWTCNAGIKKLVVRLHTQRGTFWNVYYPDIRIKRRIHDMEILWKFSAFSAQKFVFEGPLLSIAHEKLDESRVAEDRNNMKWKEQFLSRISAK